MASTSKYNYLDPTYPAYHWDFDRPRTIFCFSLRRFVKILAIANLIFSAIGLCFGLTYIMLDQLSHLELFQSNELIDNLRHLPIGIFFDNRILFQSSWTINTISENFPMIFYLHVLLNGLSLLCSINMLTAITYYKPYQASLYFIHECAYFIHIAAIFIRWTAESENETDSMQLFYGQGDWGFFTANTNIFCLALLEFFWKSFTLMMIFRSIQYLRDYCLHHHHQSNSSKSTSDENESSKFLMIHVSSHDTFLHKQFNV